jgi:soluble lytic murein transglycosylase-like protein
MATLGFARVSIKDGFVISAVDSERGSRWTARDLQKRATYPRRLTHLLIMALAVVPMSLTAASAHATSQSRPRIQLAASFIAAQDHPEDFRRIPADAAPTSTPKPTAAPKPPAPKPPAPKPRPVAFVVPASKAGIAAIIRSAAARYGVNGDQLLRVASCESGLNPNAQNRSGASGLFQFKPATFYGHGGHNIWDPADQADVAARMFSQGLASEWTCR